jgi:adenosylcobinamide-GDP ribazoletransferase
MSFLLRRISNDLLHAVQFLTRLPVSTWVRFDAGALGRCALYFPLVGGLVGLLAALVFVMADQVLPHSLAVLCAMLAPVCMTGAMHEDGLADTADGLCGHAPKERALEIMRDSRIGVYGALALIFALGFRFEVLNTLTQAWQIACLLAAAGIFSRAAGVFLLSTCPSARPESPTSRPFQGGLPRPILYACMGASVIATIILLQFHFIPVLIAITTAVALRAFFLKRLGGITGDCIGACIALTETAILVGVFWGR